jgi:hypothetical protein
MPEAGIEYGMVESRDTVFFEDSLPPPTLSEARRQQDDADVPVVQPASEHALERRRTLPLPCNLTTSPWTLSPTEKRKTRRMPSHQHARFTTFRTCPMRSTRSGPSWGWHARFGFSKEI